MTQLIRRDGYVDISRLFRRSSIDACGANPTQYIDHHDHKTGETKLAEAVLEATVKDIRDGKHIGITEEWMSRTHNEEGDYSFTMFADALNVDEGYLKRLLRAEIAKGVTPDDGVRRCMAGHRIEGTNMKRRSEHGSVYYACRECYNMRRRARRADGEKN